MTNDAGYCNMQTNGKKLDDYVITLGTSIDMIKCIEYDKSKELAT